MMSPPIAAPHAGQRVMQRLDALAEITETPGSLTRRYLTPTHAAAMQQVATWMHEAGMTTRIDSLGTVIGRIEGAKPGAAALMLGSHIDTVVDAGKYDGNLGVVAGIEVADALRSAGLRHAIEVVAFGDEEGVRFPSNLLSSRALSGAVTAADLAAADAEGVTVAGALKRLGLDRSSPCGCE